MPQQRPGSASADQELILDERPSPSSYDEPVDRLAVAVSANGIDLGVSTRSSLVRSIEFGCTIAFAGAMGCLSVKVCNSVEVSGAVTVAAFAGTAVLTVAAGFLWFRFRVGDNLVEPESVHNPLGHGGAS